MPAQNKLYTLISCCCLVLTNYTFGGGTFSYLLSPEALTPDEIILKELYENTVLKPHLYDEKESIFVNTILRYSRQAQELALKPTIRVSKTSTETFSFLLNHPFLHKSRKVKTIIHEFQFSNAEEQEKKEKELLELIANSNNQETMLRVLYEHQEYNQDPTEPIPEAILKLLHPAS